MRAELHADKTYENVEEAMQEYYIITGGNTKDVPVIGNEPNIHEYYEPSDEQKKYELLFTAGGLILTGITAFKLI